MIRGVPYDAEVEYLESTGTQWIDTGLPMRSGTSMDARVLFSADRWQMVTGGYDYYSMGVGESSAKWFLTYNDTGSGGEVAVNTWYDISVLFKKDSSVLDVDSAQVIAVGNSGTINRSSTLGLFCRERYGSGADAYMYGKIAYARFYYNGALVRDFIPVRIGSGSSAVGAMYDRVTKKLFRNKGTGAFKWGSDVARPVMGLHFMKPRDVNLSEVA